MFVRAICICVRSFGCSFSFVVMSLFLSSPSFCLSFVVVIICVVSLDVVLLLSSLLAFRLSLFRSLLFAVAFASLCRLLYVRSFFLLFLFLCVCLYLFLFSCIALVVYVC